MKNILCLAALAVASVLAPSIARADAPSFNYIQPLAQHTRAGGDDVWGWGLKGSVNPWRGLFVSGDYSHTNYRNFVSADGDRYGADIGYQFHTLETLAVYGKAGRARFSVGQHSETGNHYEAGVRVNVLSIVELEGAVGRYDFAANVDEYSATALFHFLPFTSFSLGYVRESAQGLGGDDNRVEVGVRFSF